MFGKPAVLSIFLAPDIQGLQRDVLGLPLWVWLLALVVVIILLYLLLRPSPPEAETYQEVPTSPVTEMPIETAAPSPEAVVAEPETAPAAATSPFLGEPDSLDDLTIIEGIGPKISGVLRDAGINTFQKLADTSPARISEILKAAGITLFDASTWPEQASLILAARWTELRALQEKLIAGRRE
jgi:predicted flap endonuclease-1-like 5' DNA nuclease